MQGLESVNDNISNAAGDGVLFRYAQQLSVAAYNAGKVVDDNTRGVAQLAQAHRSVRKCSVYHRGAERFALLCIKEDDATVAAFRGKLEQLAAHLATLRQIEGSVPTLVPTLLSIGVATSLSKADELNVLVR